MQYGLIGEKLGHSFSKEIHEQLGYAYALQPLARQEFAGFMQARNFKGINVTIPYKKDVLPFCDEIDARVQRIGAANTLVKQGDRLCAYNTDYDGVLYTLHRHSISLKGKVVLILGTGGTAATVKAVAADEGAAQVLVASRSEGAGTLSYAQAMQSKQVQVVYNCSPAGMYPHNGSKLLDLAAYPRLEAVVDAVYNPFKTALLLQAEDLGITAVNGLEMLVAQAVYASALFLGQPVQQAKIAEIHTQLRARLCNVSLIGMPGCGKTSLGKALAKTLGKQFVDLDAEIVQKAGKPIAQLFAEEGEHAFRKLESEITTEFATKNGQVLSTGGGVVKNAENVAALRQNGPVLFIDAPVETLVIGKGRPLSQSRQDVHNLYKQRYNLYCQAADAKIEFHAYFKENEHRLLQAYNTLMQLDMG